VWDTLKPILRVLGKGGKNKVENGNVEKKTMKEKYMGEKDTIVFPKFVPRSLNIDFCFVKY